MAEDLENIKNGSEVIHASDLNKKKTLERKRREKAKVKRIEKLENMLIKIGYDGLEHIDCFHVKNGFRMKACSNLK